MEPRKSCQLSEKKICRSSDEHFLYIFILSLTRDISYDSFLLDTHNDTLTFKIELPFLKYSSLLVILCEKRWICLLLREITYWMFTYNILWTVHFHIKFYTTKSNFVNAIKICFYNVAKYLYSISIFHILELEAFTYFPRNTANSIRYTNTHTHTNKHFNTNEVKQF